GLVVLDRLEDLRIAGRFAGHAGDPGAAAALDRRRRRVAWIGVPGLRAAARPGARTGARRAAAARRGAVVADARAIVLAAGRQHERQGEGRDRERPHGSSACHLLCHLVGWGERSGAGRTERQPTTASTANSAVHTTNPAMSEELSAMPSGSRWCQSA